MNKIKAALAAVGLLFLTACVQNTSEPDYNKLVLASVELKDGCSGVLISKNEILTASHCTEWGEKKEFIVDINGKKVTAYLKRSSKEKDLAVLFVPSLHSEVWIDIAETQGSLGDTIWVVGNPRSLLPDTITKGIWSFMKRLWPDGAVLNQMDISGAPGNSGSMVVNSEGKVVGILVRGLFNGQAEFAGQYVFAVMLEDIKEFLK